MRTRDKQARHGLPGRPGGEEESALWTAIGSMRAYGAEFWEALARAAQGGLRGGACARKKTHLGQRFARDRDHGTLKPSKSDPHSATALREWLVCTR